MKKINILYSTITGNTKSFANKLKYESNLFGEIKQIGQETDYNEETEPFIALVPTYLGGGTGTGSNVYEEMTYPLHDYIEFKNNRDLLVGVVGSGNVNFNEQFALTGKRYSKEFNKPLISTYELRGSIYDVDQVIKFIEK